MVGWAIVTASAVVRTCGALTLLTLITGLTVAQRTRFAPMPRNGALVIGRRTYFDVGPPFDYYEIFVVEPGNSTLSVVRLRLTPPGHICLQPGTLEVATTTIADTMSDLLGGKDPCAIPDKELQREAKRCKRCPTFSGADVMVEVTCGDRARLLRMDILDRDLFDRNPHPPQHTSWSMALLERLDRALGDAVSGKPAFSLEQSSSSSTSSAFPQLSSVTALRQGAFDLLFPGAQYKPSTLYLESLKPPVKPTVELIESPTVKLISFSLPSYPHLARAAHIQGKVTFSVAVDEGGEISEVAIASGHPLLRPAVVAEAKKWKFPVDSAGKTFAFVVEFRTNCPEQK